MKKSWGKLRLRLPSVRDYILALPPEEQRKKIEHVCRLADVLFDFVVNEEKRNAAEEKIPQPVINCALQFLLWFIDKKWSQRRPRDETNLKRDEIIVHLHDIERKSFGAIAKLLPKLNPDWRITTDAAKKAYKSFKEYQGEYAAYLECMQILNGYLERSVPGISDTGSKGLLPRI